MTLISLNGFVKQFISISPVWEPGPFVLQEAGDQLIDNGYYTANIIFRLIQRSGTRGMQRNRPSVARNPKSKTGLAKGPGPGSQDLEISTGPDLN
jgi:hypothetical protein